MSLTAEHPADIAKSYAAVQTTGGAPVLGLAAEMIPAAEWDSLLSGLDGAVQEQLHAFARTRWPSVKHEPVLFKLDGEVVGGTLVMVQPLPLRLSALAVVKWGPILKDESRPDADAVYRGMVESLIELYARRRGMMLSIMARAATGPRNPAYEHLLARGFAPSSRLLFPARYIVNLKLDDAAMRRSFHQKWRYHLNKSEKQGLSFERADAGRIGEFDRLYSAMTDRKRFPDHSAYDTVPALMSVADDALRPELFFVRESGDVVAGAIIWKAGRTAVYLYGATNDRALPLRAGYFMHWHIMRWLRDNTRAEWYDLGGTDGFQGLHQFKKGMVGDAGVIEPVPAVANYAANPWAWAVGNAAYKLRDGMQHARRFLERSRAGLAKPDQARPDSHDGDGQ